MKGKIIIVLDLVKIVIVHKTKKQNTDVLIPTKDLAFPPITLKSHVCFLSFFFLFFVLGLQKKRNLNTISKSNHLLSFTCI
jgi:hypothetical protein